MFRQEAGSRDLKRRHEGKLRTNNYQVCPETLFGSSALRNPFLSKVNHILNDAADSNDRHDLY